jgi:hypothetical protein
MVAYAKVHHVMHPREESGASPPWHGARRRLFLTDAIIYRLTPAQTGHYGFCTTSRLAPRANHTTITVAGRDPVEGGSALKKLHWRLP